MVEISINDDDQWGVYAFKGVIVKGVFYLCQVYHKLENIEGADEYLKKLMCELGMRVKFVEAKFYYCKSVGSCENICTCDPRKKYNINEIK
jgi:hypothetical protein